MRVLKFLCVIAVTNASGVFAGEKPEEKKAQVSFDGKTLVLAAEGKNPGESVKEFIPKGQKLDSWTQLASIREYSKLNDPKAIAENLVKALKLQNPRAPHQMMQNPKTGAYLVDFITWPRDGAYVEFNIFKYEKKAGGGMTAHQYALRAYKDQKKFLVDLKTLRKRLVELMAKDGLTVK